MKHTINLIGLKAQLLKKEQLQATVGGVGDTCYCGPCNCQCDGGAEQVSTNNYDSGIFSEGHRGNKPPPG
jgi:hypothetical protein